MNLSRARLSELDERSLREDVLIPLFKAMGFRDVSLHHGGSLEQGKDIVMWRPEAIQARANYGVVAKVTGITGRATGKSSAAEVYTQVKQCFGKPFIDPVTLEERPVDRVLVVTSGEIIKEARESLRSLLASDGYDRSVELVDGDKLWELIDAHLPQRVVIDQLSQAARTLEDLSPNYRVVSKTGSDGVTLSLEPKHPDAAAREPAAMKFTVAFPDTQEGRALKDAMEKWMKTGEAFEIPGGYVKDFEPPTFLESVMPKDAVYSISLGPRASGHELIADLVAVSSDGSESASLSHVQFRTLRGGAEEVVFSSSHQQAPWHFTLTLQDQGRRASISAQFDFSGCSVREEYDALKFLDVVSKGAELAIRGAQ